MSLQIYKIVQSIWVKISWKEEKRVIKEIISDKDLLDHLETLYEIGFDEAGIGSIFVSIAVKELGNETLEEAKSKITRTIEEFTKIEEIKKYKKLSTAYNISAQSFTKILSFNYKNLAKILELLDDDVLGGFLDLKKDLGANGKKLGDEGCFSLNSICTSLNFLDSKFNKSPKDLVKILCKKEFRDDVKKYYAAGVFDPKKIITEHNDKGFPFSLRGKNWTSPPEIIPKFKDSKSKIKLNLIGEQREQEEKVEQTEVAKRKKSKKRKKNEKSKKTFSHEKLLKKLKKEVEEIKNEQDPLSMTYRLPEVDPEGFDFANFVTQEEYFNSEYDFLSQKESFEAQMQKDEAQLKEPEDTSKWAETLLDESQIPHAQEETQTQESDAQHVEDEILKFLNEDLGWERPVFDEPQITDVQVEQEPDSTTRHPFAKIPKPPTSISRF